ncbi:MAG: guanylate kinase [Firmicutes bacterium]|nr:guanylate kinase [Candidatus Fermentithermobacillaceae bacterium]
MKKGLLFVITAPSGCGKGTLRRALLSEHSEIKFCPSITTRQPRPGEVDGVDYTFVSMPEFFRRRENDEFVEWAEVYGNYYATPRQDVEKAIAEGSLIILEKDVQGARTLRKVYPDGIFIFILPPSMEELKRRIESRGTEEESEMAMRFDSARREIADLSDFDYVIINTDMERAKDRLSAIILGERIAHGDYPCESQRRSIDDNPNPAGPNSQDWV